MYKGVILMSLLFMLSCGENNQSQAQKEQGKQADQSILQGSIEKLEAELSANTDGKVDQIKAQELIDKSVEYVKAFPNDTKSPVYLFRSAEVCVGIGQYESAIKHWEQVKKDYSNHEKAAIALFLQGFTCENQINDKNRAKKYYQDFLTRYPKHEYNDQVQMLLKNIDISPEELIKQFKEQRENQ